jgi:predicted nucleic acid-binding protein
LSTYLDTSALLAYYLPEPRSEAFNALISAAASPAISNLVECEMVAVIGQKVRGGSYNRRDADRALGRFRSDVQRGAFRYIVVDNRLIQAAIALLENFGVALRTLDALHVTAVLEYQCDLITGDARMARTAERLGIMVSYVPSALSNVGVDAVDALINTLGLDGVLDYRKWDDEGSRERKELKFIRTLHPEHDELWCHVPSGAVVRVRLEDGQFYGRLLR